MKEIEKKLWRRVNRFCFIFRICPFVRMISVCNNLAFGNVDERSDIDVFVVAKKGRLFMVRTFLTFFLHIFGVRRYGKKISGRFCLSFFIDDSFLDLSSVAIKNDVYLAYWLKSMLPVVDDGVSFDLVRANLWAREFFVNEKSFEISLEKVCRKKSFVKKVLEFVFGGAIGDFFEEKLKSWQILRAEKKMDRLMEKSGLMIAQNVLKFHNVDRRREYRDKWTKLYGENFKIPDEGLSFE